MVFHRTHRCVHVHAGCHAASTQQPQPPKQQDLYKFRIDQSWSWSCGGPGQTGQAVTDLKRKTSPCLRTASRSGSPALILKILIPRPGRRRGPSQQTSNGKPVAQAKPILTAKDADQALSNKRSSFCFLTSGHEPGRDAASVDAAKKYVQTKMTSVDLIAIVSSGSSIAS